MKKLLFKTKKNILSERFDITFRVLQILLLSDLMEKTGFLCAFL